MKKARTTRQPKTRREKLSAEADAILERAGESALVGPRERAGKNAGEVILREDLKQRALTTTILVTRDGASPPAPYVPVPESERHRRIARALKIPLRTVRDTCRSLNRFLKSSMYRDRLEALRSGNSWMRRPEKATTTAWITTLPNGRRGRLRITPSTVRYTWTIERWRKEPWRFEFEGLPDAMRRFQERAFIVNDSFGAWQKKRRPKIRTTTLERSRQIALWYIIEESDVHRRTVRP